MKKNQKYTLKNTTILFQSKMKAKLKVSDLESYFQELLRKKNRSVAEESLLSTDYAMYKLFLVMKKTPCWSTRWIYNMKKYLESLNYPMDLVVESAPIPTSTKVLSKEESFGKFLARVSVIRTVLNLRPYTHQDSDILTEELLFERLDLDRALDPDFSTESTYYTQKDLCLASQATPYYLKNAEENTLDFFKVFRRENPDRTHLCQFYQLEYVKKYTGADPVNQLLKDFKTIYRLLGLETPVEVRPTRNNYTWPSFEFFTSDGPDSTGLVEIGNSGIMDPLVLQKSSTAYDRNAYYLAGAIGLERLYNIITNKKNITEAKNDYTF